MISSKRTIKSLTALFVAMAFMFVGNALVVSSVGVILRLEVVDFPVIVAIDSKGTNFYKIGQAKYKRV